MLVENGVTVAEVAKRLKTSSAAVETEARQLGISVGPNWAGQLSISEWDAHALVSGSMRREMDQHDEWAAHVVEAEAWHAERKQVYDQAVEDRRKAAQRKGLSTPASMQAAWGAGQAAAEQFEREHPAPTYSGQTAGTPAVTPATPVSPLRSIANKVLDSVR